ncbi:hypothetical protein [Arthrobacter sp. NPDC090010]|uniref:hypothetical protein n=1 Tax=Arthrobacter sp. NPDC090010 TaxID=3363942 RepID=UPI00382062A5
MELDVSGLTAFLGIAITAVGGLGGFFIRRADRKRERREAVVEEILRQRIKELEMEVASARASEDKAVDALRQVERTAMKWRGQLTAASIVPDPADLPEV